MQFHAEFFPKEFSRKISLKDPLLLIGSCFTEQVGNKLRDHKFEILQNPHGILFNPVSIEKAIDSYVKEKVYKEKDLFYYNELWQSWEHHSRFSDMDKETALYNMNDECSRASVFLRKAKWMIITLGSSFVYERTEVNDPYSSIVANCHKIPADKFNRRLLSSSEVINYLWKMIDNIRKVNKSIRVIFTISPVRHLREGFIENNRSKAALIEAVHSVTNNENILYFPSYELVIDDLRDYRFYAEDMVHPNYSATNYVWQKFIDSAMSTETIMLMKEISQVRAAASHKAFNPRSEQHKKFRETFLEKIKQLESLHSFLDFTDERSLLTK